MQSAPLCSFATETVFACDSSVLLEHLRCMPAEPVDCCGSRLVFTSHPATIADRIEMTKQERIVDLARSRLIAAGIVGKLDMGDARQMLLRGASDIALHDLHVINVVLDEEV